LKSKVLQPQSQRTLTRSLSCLSSRKDDEKNSILKIVKSKSLVGCSCKCGMHTEGDSHFVEFLTQEIKLEKENQKGQNKLPSIPGFDITVNDSEIVFKKDTGDEVLTVKVNVNNSMTIPLEAENHDEDDTEMVAQPNFVVGITKGGNTLSIECAFDQEGMEDDQAQSYADKLAINEVYIHSGEAGVETFSLSASVMDGTMYDHFLTMMEERGVNEKFVDLLVDYCTIYEQKKYIGFMEDLQKFIKT